MTNHFQNGDLPAQNGDLQAQNGDLQAELQDYLDERLSPDQVVALESRLQADESLRDQLESLRRVGDLVRAAMPSDSDLEVPENFTASVRERIDAEALADNTARARRKTWGRVLAFSYAAAALLVAGLSVHWMFTHPSRDQASRDQASTGQASKDQAAGDRAFEGQRTAKEATERAPSAAEGERAAGRPDANDELRNELLKVHEEIASNDGLGADAPAKDLDGLADSPSPTPTSEAARAPKAGAGGRASSGSGKAKGAKQEDAKKDGANKDGDWAEGKHRQPGGAVPPRLREPEEADKMPTSREGKSVPPEAKSRRQRKDAERAKQDANRPEVYFSLREPHPIRARALASKLSKLLTPTGDAAKDAEQLREFNALARQVQLVQVDAKGHEIGSFRKRDASERGERGDAPSDRDRAEPPKPLRIPVNPSSGPSSFVDTWPREVLTRLLAQRVAVQRDNFAPAREQAGVPEPAAPASPAPAQSGTAPSRVRIRFFHR